MKLLFTLLLIPNFYSAISQDFQFVSSANIEEPTNVSIDQAGNLYYATYRGDIIKYDPLLKNKVVFSPPNPNRVTALEAWQGLRVFVFHQDLQVYRLINRNLSLHEDYYFPQNTIAFAEIVAPSFDNNLWAIDQVDFSLVKYDITLRQLSARTPLDQLLDPDNYSILFMKEYQNRLFISTEYHGILIFDNLGTFLKKFDYKNISFFNFNDDHIFFIAGKSLVQIHLYDDSTTVKDLPSDFDWLYTLIFDKWTYLFSKNKIIQYK